MQQSSGDYLIRQLRHREKAEEDRFFAAQDRQLIEQLHSRQPETLNGHPEQRSANPPPSP